MTRPVTPVTSVPARPSRSSGPDRRRLLWAAITGSGMLSGIYWTFPPIFADADATATRTVQTATPVKTASLTAVDLTSTRSLPDIPLTPSIEAHRRSITLLEEGVNPLLHVGDLRQLVEVETFGQVEGGVGVG